jgi:aminoglycoside phosphotransferase (APT) family kinase protein
MHVALPTFTEETDLSDLVAGALGSRPERVVRQVCSQSGKAVYRVDLPGGQSAVLRTSDRPTTFAFTRANLQTLGALGLPVQSVLAAGPGRAGGSYIILNWIPGRDLIYELGGMSRLQSTVLAEQIVTLQKRVGQLPPAARFGWAPIGRSGNLQRWTQVFGEAASASQVNDGTPLGALRARLCNLRRRVESYFDTVQPLAFLDDLTTKNVLIDQGQLTGIIDIDFVCYGDPLLSVGATMASIAGDCVASSAFYGEELVRCWNPCAQQRLAIWFYAALWAIGFLQSTDVVANPGRAQSLSRAADSWLAAAEAQPF